MADVQPFSLDNLSPAQLDVAETIGKKFQAAGLNPDLFVPLAFHESSLKPDNIGPEIVKSPNNVQRAMGLFQFTPDTAKFVGLQHPLDTNENTDAAIKLVQHYMKDPNIGTDPVKLLAAWHGGPHSDFVKTGDENKLPLSTMDYLLAMHARTGGELPSVTAGSNPAPTSSNQLPPPLSSMTTTDAMATAVPAAKAGAAIAGSGETARGVKGTVDYAIKKLAEENARTTGANLATNATAGIAQTGGTGTANYGRAFGLSDFDARRAANMSKQPGGVWDLKATIPEQDAKLAQMGITNVGESASGSNVLVPKTIQEVNAETKALLAPPKKVSPLTALFKQPAEGALPVMAKSGARMLGTTLPVVGAALDTQDAINRSRQGDPTGSLISGTGAATGYGAAGAALLGFPVTAGLLGLGGLAANAINMGRDIYKMTPMQREELKNTTLFPSSPPAGQYYR